MLTRLIQIRMILDKGTAFTVILIQYILNTTSCTLKILSLFKHGFPKRERKIQIMGNIFTNHVGGKCYRLLLFA